MDDRALPRRARRRPGAVDRADRDVPDRLRTALAACDDLLAQGGGSPRRSCRRPDSAGRVWCWVPGLGGRRELSVGPVKVPRMEAHHDVRRASGGPVRARRRRQDWTPRGPRAAPSPGGSRRTTRTRRGGVPGRPRPVPRRRRRRVRPRRSSSGSGARPYDTPPPLHLLIAAARRGCRTCGRCSSAR